MEFKLRRAKDEGILAALANEYKKYLGMSFDLKSLKPKVRDRLLGQVEGDLERGGKGIYIAIGTVPTPKNHKPIISLIVAIFSLIISILVAIFK